MLNTSRQYLKNDLTKTNFRFSGQSLIFHLPSNIFKTPNTKECLWKSITSCIMLDKDLPRILTTQFPAPQRHLAHCVVGTWGMWQLFLVKLWVTCEKSNVFVFNMCVCFCLFVVVFIQNYTLVCRGHGDCDP